jgi:hypothetical protein
MSTIYYKHPNLTKAVRIVDDNLLTTISFRKIEGKQEWTVMSTHAEIDSIDVVTLEQTMEGLVKCDAAFFTKLLHEASKHLIASLNHHPKVINGRNEQRS